MNDISNEVCKQANEAFHAYSQAVVTRLLKRPTWKLDTGPLERVLATGNEAKVHEFINKMRRAHAELLRAITV